MTIPTKAHKIIMPWKFTTLGNNFIVQTPNKSLLLKFNDESIVVHTADKKATLSIFDLRGRQVKQMTVGNKMSLNLKSIGLSNGIWLLKLKVNNQEIKLKILLNK